MSDGLPMPPKRDMSEGGPLMPGFKSEAFSGLGPAPPPPPMMRPRSVAPMMCGMSVTDVGVTSPTHDELPLRLPLSTFAHQYFPLVTGYRLAGAEATKVALNECALRGR